MDYTSQEFIKRLKLISKTGKEGIPKIEIFKLSKEFIKMPVPEVVKLLRNINHDLRVGAVAILDWKARNTKSTEQDRKDIYDVYIENHRWIDDWGLVDRAASYVVGEYLFDKNRSVLYKLAKSDIPMERRTTIVSTYFFIRQNQLDDTFKIAEILVRDPDEYVQKAVGSWIREAGKRDKKRLIEFLKKYYKVMPRVIISYATEHLSAMEKKYISGNN